jgi:beta-glucosidase
MAWYPGQAGGTAVAEVLFGAVSPGGKLPVTFVRSVDQLPPFTDYSMKGRTYRYMEEEPLYPFGYGLSYSTFRFDSLSLSASSIPAGREITASVRVTNTGSRRADEVAQVYVTDLEASVRVPRWQLAGFSRVSLDPGRSETLTFTLTPRQMSIIDRVYAGGSQPDTRSQALTGTRPLSAEFSVAGSATHLAW